MCTWLGVASYERQMGSIMHAVCFHRKFTKNLSGQTNNTRGVMCEFDITGVPELETINLILYPVLTLITVIYQNI